MNKPDSLTQAWSLVETILSEMSGLSKPRLRFLRWIFGAWLGLPVRRTVSNLARFGPYCEKSIRLQRARVFEFAEFGRLLIHKNCGTERICAFDPTYVAKAGQQTYGVDYWWCGTAQKAMRGLELGVIGIVDVAARSAFSLQSTQTPCQQTLREQGKNLMQHYVSLLEEQRPRLEQLGVRVVTADAYFAKKSFVEAMTKLNFAVVTRLRHGRPLGRANLRYLYYGPRAQSGRPKKYEGKVDCQRIDKRRLRLFQQEAHCCYYSGVVYAVALGRVVRMVYIEENKGKNPRYRILMSSDVELAPEKIVAYYKLRFQIEFLIRGCPLGRTKSHAGLEECQARDEAKLFFHFNMALTTVSLVKSAFWLCVPPPERGAFSMRNAQLLFTGQLWTNRVFHNLGLDLSLTKHQRAYERCLDMRQLSV